ncbi:MAG: 4-(cytidine 5'-diphospho)-2-C-methyl-D-erythritol kinase [Bryobacteraceae bacterium]|nr:4-(cytidine 5'-diphospho)-2-C-methyl-D-erythritol kinase [Bryobacteraceae bacterium]
MAPRRAAVPSFAKVNLSLKVLGRRQDGYHELRTVFQTIGLADRITLEFTPARRGLEIELDDPLAIPDNLVLRAARLFCESERVRGRLRLRLDKRIPMGAGLGGGSANAAAVLLALGPLTGRGPGPQRLHEMAASLGSDVPFFLYGGTALGLGRGEELYPLPEAPRHPVLVLMPPVHVSTAEAYRALGRPELTSPVEFRKLDVFQSFVWRGEYLSGAENDFEAAVFRLHPELKRWKRKLERLGAQSARLSGSGAALFGVFPDRAKLQGALPQFSTEPLKVFSTTFVSRRQYRARICDSLREHVVAGTWPPRSRYVRDEQ